ncbi:MAG: hypothetical protein JW762_07950 [Dehalococcoidales bacterium]|nr:hypothetical protein [Dehalococcoidales bacterium]
MKIKELTVGQLQALIEDTIEAKMEEILGDPDEGLELTDEAKVKIEESLAALKRGEKQIPLEKVANNLGLQWN